MSTVPVPEFRKLVAVAKQFVAGEIHFCFLVGPLSDCRLWCKVHGSHHAIQLLVAEWELGVDRVWNEYRTYPETLPVEDYRRQLAADLGEVPPI
jgi:hypothetical protein